MNILFVSSGNSGKISEIISAQGKSLEKAGINVSYFLIEGKGLTGYLKNLPSLKKSINKNNYDLIHAHYSLSAFVLSLAIPKVPVIVSLMGSDAKKGVFFNYVLSFFQKYIWNSTIVKSEDMKASVGFKNNVNVIPNGVDISIFKPLDQLRCKSELSWCKDKIHILFAANPERKEKNYALFKNSLDFIHEKYPNIKTHFLKDISHDKIPMYLNAADVVCLSSRWEGSPNVIKEAMACNRPLVCTNVGDVKWLFGNIEGCFLCSKHEVNEYSKVLEGAIHYSITNISTFGRKRIKDLRLSSTDIVQKLIGVYQNAFNKI